MPDSKGPMDPGSKQGEIITNMCEANVSSSGKQPDIPPTHKYKDMPSKSGEGSGSGASDIMGPGDVFIKNKK